MRVLDLTRLLPGPVCTLYLADLGADVVKVEDTGAGDYARDARRTPAHRNAPRRSSARSTATSVAWPSTSSRARARRRSWRWRSSADVDRRRLPAGRRRGAARRLRSRARRSIRASSTASISRLRPDRTARAPRRTRHQLPRLRRRARPDGRARRPSRACNLQIADLLGGAASAAIAHPRCAVGAHAHAVAAATSTSRWPMPSLAHNIFPLQRAGGNGTVAPRGEDLLTGGVPCYGVYPTRDGRWLAIGALETKFWNALCAAIERPDLVPGQFAHGARGRRASARHWRQSSAARRSPTGARVSRRSIVA